MQVHDTQRAGLVIADMQTDEGVVRVYSDVVLHYFCCCLAEMFIVTLSIAVLCFYVILCGFAVFGFPFHPLPQINIFSKEETTVDVFYTQAAMLKISKKKKRAINNYFGIFIHKLFHLFINKCVNFDTYY